MATIAHNVEETERTSDIRLSKNYTFDQMPLNDNLRKSLSEAGFRWPTSVQANAIPLGKAGNDLMVQSKSGTGKTLTFCAILLEMLDTRCKQPQGIIIAPTREIAVQIESVLLKLAKYSPGFKVECVIGGLEVMNDRKKIQGATVIVGTPGRIWHLIRCQMFNPSKVRFLVIDEADKIMSKSFESDFQEIYNSLPAKKQVIACSATLTEEYDAQITSYMQKPFIVSTARKATFLLGIKQFVYEIPEQRTDLLETYEKRDALGRIFSAISYNQCIVFTNSHFRTETYSTMLGDHKWPCDYITGTMPQKDRLKVFKQFREYKTRILISTDLMSRGIDSENVNLVVNLEVPDDAPTYLHRIGRAGRFGSHGVAITIIATAEEREKFKKLIESIDSEVKIFKIPTDEEIPNFLEKWTMEDKLETFDHKTSDSNECCSAETNHPETSTKIESQGTESASSSKQMNRSETTNCNEANTVAETKKHSFTKIRCKRDRSVESSSSESELNSEQISRETNSKKASILKMLVKESNKSQLPMNDEDIFEDYKKAQQKLPNGLDSKKHSPAKTSSTKPKSPQTTSVKRLTHDEDLLQDLLNVQLLSKKSETESVKNINKAEDLFEDYEKAQLSISREGSDVHQNDSCELSKKDGVTRLIKKKKHSPKDLNRTKSSMNDPKFKSSNGTTQMKGDFPKAPGMNTSKESQENQMTDNLTSSSDSDEEIIDMQWDSDDEFETSANERSVQKDLNPQPSTSSANPSGRPSNSRNNAVPVNVIVNQRNDDDNSSYRTVTSNKSSGFDEETTSKESSGIASSLEYFVNSEEESFEVESSSTYDSADSFVQSDETEYESDLDGEEPQQLQYEMELETQQELSHNDRYQLAYKRWTATYWNQVTQIQDYAKFASYVRNMKP